MKVIEIQERQINRAAAILALAFEKDPLFRYIFKTEEKYEKGAAWLFSTWVRWSVMYGNAWMTEDEKGVMLLRSMKNPDMSFVSMVRAGMLAIPFRLGWGAFRRFYFEIVNLLDKKHAQIMGDTPHWYGWMVGVDPAYKGHGGILMQHCEQLAEKAVLPIYLETNTDNNLSMYAYKKFEVKDTARLAKGDFTIYFMVRQPQLNNI